MATSAFGIANIVASALLLTLGLLFLRAARRSEFTVAFAVYSILAAGQKFAGGMWLYYDTPFLSDPQWQAASTLFLLASTPTLAHALAAFTWERRFTQRPLWQKALLYVPFLALAPLGAANFRWTSLALAAVFLAILVVFLIAVALKARRASSIVTVSQAKYVIAYLAIAAGFSAEARVILLLYGTLPWWEVSLAYTVATGILVYGILRTHLFDIDLKVKWTLRRGTLVGAFVVVFLAVAEIAQGILSDAYGYAAGGLAAALMLLAIRPLDRLAARVADSAMPEVQETEGYKLVRKHLVYRAAVESVLEDGEVTPKERRVLATLADELGLSSREALDIETLAATASR